MNILCVGQAVYDITFPCNKPLIENQKYRIRDRLECMGAPAANASYLCALWGAQVTLMARIGDDLYGKHIQQTLSTVGVDTTHMYVDKNIPTSISCILANDTNGNRTIFNCPMAEGPYPFKISDNEIDIVLFDGHELDVSLSILKQFPNAISILDAGTYKENILPLIQSVDYLICSQDFAQQYTGININLQEETTLTKVFSSLESINRNHIAITLGEKGCLFKQEQKIQHIPAFSVRAIDTTGAGDIFHGAFAYALSISYSFHDALLLASLASSISVESLGGQTSIPNRDDMRQRINKYHLNCSCKKLHDF